MKQFIFLFVFSSFFCSLTYGQVPLEIECVGSQGIKMTQGGSFTSFEASVTSLGSKLGNTSNTPMDFYTNNLTRMTIANNGKIGVGIASPQLRFHVSEPGNTGGPMTPLMMLQSSLSKRPTLAFSEDGLVAMTIEYDGRLLGDNNKININDNADSPLFSFTMGGRLGVGDTEPLAPIHIVEEGTNNVPTTLLLLESNTSNRPRLSFSESNSGVEAMSLEYDGNGGAATNRMHIGSDEEGPIATFVRTSKYVGIGTIDPTKPLHINGGVNEGLRITRQGSSVVLDAISNGTDAALGTTSNHPMRLLTNNTIRMHIEEDGNVGVGTTFPERPLHVQGQSDNDGLRVTRTGSSVHLDGFTNTSTGFLGTTTNHGLRLLTNNNTRMFIRNDGNVGIGTTVPIFDLQVSGTIAGSTIICGTTSLCSDARFKRDINPVRSSMEKLSKLRGVNYYWDNEKFAEKGFGDEKQIGFIAQEIQEIFPELVHADPEGYLSVDYTSLVPVLVEALKEQQNEIETYKTEVNQRLAELELKLSKLK